MPQREESFSPEELRLAELFDTADRLSEDAQALDRFLESLELGDREEVGSALACANAVRMAGSESPPAMTGTAWTRILTALYPESTPDSETWGSPHPFPEIMEETRRDPLD